MGVTTRDIRKEVKKHIDMADDKTVRMIYAMLEVEQREDQWTDADFIKEMDRRAMEHEAGNVGMLTLTQLEDNARKAYKQRKK
jgi:hypothetical protein